MIPEWKIKRELIRLKVQMSGLLGWFPERLQQFFYDKKRVDLIKVSSGEHLVTKKIAIFVIYQPQSVAKSILKTCEHLNSHGYAIVVVSNGNLSDTDRNAIQKKCHLLAERSNFGYDFGGYRDGVWLLDQHKIEPDQVLFLNDSVWFPIAQNSSLLQDMDQTQADYVGVQVFGDIHASGKKRGIFGSYCFLLRKSLYYSPTVIEFWRNYKLTSNKEMTLRLGERALSRLLLQLANTSIGLYSTDRFMATLHGLTHDDLQKALEEAVIFNPNLVQCRETLLSQIGSTSFCQDVCNLLYENAKSKNYIGSSPIVSIKNMEFPMIKKNSEMLYVQARHRILAAVEAGEITNIDPVILDEIKQVQKGFEGVHLE